MATLKELSAGLTFEDVWQALGGGEAPEGSREHYQQMLTALQTTAPGKNPQNMRIVLEEAYDFWGEDDEGQLQACGYIPGDEDPYALGVRPLDELVAMPVDPDTLAQYTPAQIVAQLLLDSVYDSAAIHTVWNAQAEETVSGLYDSQVCIDSQLDGSLAEVRSQLGLTATEDNKTKYGFLF